MKANRCRPAFISQVAVVAGLGTLSACVPATVPSPVARPVTLPRVTQRPALPPIAAASDWRNLPQAPGDWTWSRGGLGVSQASFGNALTIVCLQPGQVRLTIANRSGPVTIRTTSVTRTVGAAGPDARGPTNITVDLQASDPLLDAMAFSRGRFALDFRGAPPLVVPSWPEFGRVIEDCR